MQLARLEFQNQLTTFQKPVNLDEKTHLTLVGIAFMLVFLIIFISFVVFYKWQSVDVHIRNQENTTPKVE